MLFTKADRPLSTKTMHLASMPDSKIDSRPQQDFPFMKKSLFAEIQGIGKCHSAKRRLIDAARGDRPGPSHSLEPCLDRGD